MTSLNPISRLTCVGVLALTAAWASVFASACAAQEFPAAKPIRLVVPFPAGGSSDATARILAQKMSTLLNASVIVDNKGGAGGVIGTDFVAKSAADGYTLVLVDIFHTTAPVYTRKMPYDVVKDFTAISMVAKTPAYLFTNPAFEVKTAKDVIELGRAQPGKGTMAIPGTGSVVVELFRARANAQFTNVPYRGSAPALLDLMSGQVNLMFTTIASAGGHLKSGKLRMLATTNPTRHPDFPDTPTFNELGIKGMDYEQWFGVLAPANLPRTIVDKLSGAIAEAVKSPDMRERLAGLSLDPAAGGPDEFKKRVEGDTLRWTKLAAELGIKPLD